MAERPETFARGDLLEDAPGLHRLLTRKLTAVDQRHLECAYQAAVLIGAGEDAGLRRTEGASFNPKPARLCQLLLVELAIIDPVPLSAAFFCAAPVQESTMSKGQFEEEIKLARQALVFPNLDAVALEETYVQELALALRLDLIRHVHMVADSAAEILALIDTTTADFLPRLAPQRGGLLRIKLEAHIEKLRRLYGTQDSSHLQ